MDDYYIHVDYPNGHLNLVLDEFFPCTIRAARIMFPLINRYAAAAEKSSERSFSASAQTLNQHTARFRAAIG